MAPRLRMVMLTTHVASSVGLIGAVASFLALAIGGLAAGNPETIRASYVAMQVLAWFVIAPLAFAALAIGVIESLGTTWGLFRHYWLVAKLLLTLVAVVVLLLQFSTIDGVAGAAIVGLIGTDQLWDARQSLILHAAGGLFVLLLPVVLSVYKPRGKTGYGERRERVAPAP